MTTGKTRERLLFEHGVLDRYQVRGDSVWGPRGHRLRLHDHDGYPAFNVRMPKAIACRINETVRILVHRLVAWREFGTSMFRPGVQVRHLNGDPKDNRPQNLLLGTPIEVRAAHRARNGYRKFTRAQIEEMRRLRDLGWPLSALARYFDAGRQHISKIVNGKLYKEAQADG